MNKRVPAHRQPSLPSRFVLERELVLDEPACRERSSFAADYIEWARKRGREFEERCPTFEVLRRRVEGRGVTGPVRCFSRWIACLRAPFPVGAAVVVIVLIVTVIGWRSAREELTAKGGIEAALFLNGSEIPGDRDLIRCAAGDTIQLLVTAESSVWYYVVYREGDGPYRSYVPDRLEGRTRLSGDGAMTRLPYSIVLDSCREVETIYCLLASTPLDFCRARKYLEQGESGQAQTERELHVHSWKVIRDE
jgi:hypothetical protein